MQKENTPASKIVPSLVTLLFGVMFTLGGLLAGVLPLAQHIQGGWRTQNLVAVPADVLALELKTHDRTETTYQVRAEFGYDFNGAHYRSTRIGAADNGSDNIDDYQQQQFQQLQTARVQGRQVLWPKSHYALQVECRCTHVDSSGDSIAEKILWADKKSYPQLPHGTSVIDMVLDLRGNLPPAGKLPEKDNEIVWHLILKVFGGEVKFVLPVSAG